MKFHKHQLFYVLRRGLKMLSTEWLALAAYPVDKVLILSTGAHPKLNGANY